MASFFETVTAAINDAIEYGYESEARLQYWLDEIRRAALADMVPERELQKQLDRVLTSTWQRLVDKGGVLRQHEGVERFTIERVRPALRAELDRRLLASASLIKLNREQVIAETLRRFQGWATSIPAGGTDIADRREVKDTVRQGLASLPFLERRVLIDQGHKLNTAVSDIIAADQDAIAAEWHSHWREAGYNYRRDHKERDGVVYARKGSWALRRRLMRVGPGGYYEDHERPGEFVYCRCYVRWIYNLRDLPAEMLTDAGREALATVRAKITAT